MAHCFNQFEIEELARKLFTFWTPKGLYWYKRLVMMNNPASLECHRWVREVVKECKGVTQIKDNILVHDMEDMHEGRLGKVLHKLQEAGFTLRRVKWELGMAEAEWFGHRFSGTTPRVGWWLTRRTSSGSCPDL